MEAESSLRRARDGTDIRGRFLRSAGGVVDRFGGIGGNLREIRGALAQARHIGGSARPASLRRLRLGKSHSIWGRITPGRQLLRARLRLLALFAIAAPVALLLGRISRARATIADLVATLIDAGSGRVEIVLGQRGDAMRDLVERAPPEQTLCGHRPQHRSTTRAKQEGGDQHGYASRRLAARSGSDMQERNKKKQTSGE